MSKISPMQAEALGLKSSSAPKAAAVKIAPKTIISAPAKAMPKPTIKAAVKPASKQAAKAAPKVAPAAVVKTVAKTVISSPAKKPITKKTVAKKPVNKVAKKEVKKHKPEKVKMERDSFTMPKEEYAQITLMKVRLTAMGQPAKKSELLRAGIKLLAAMSDNTLKMTLAKIPVIKTGRPNKKD